MKNRIRGESGGLLFRVFEFHIEGQPSPPIYRQSYDMLAETNLIHNQKKEAFASKNNFFDIWLPGTDSIPSVIIHRATPI